MLVPAQLYFWRTVGPIVLLLMGLGMPGVGGAQAGFTEGIPPVFQPEADPTSLETALLRVEVLGDGGVALPLARFHGFRQAVLKAQWPYSLRVTNLSEGRIRVVFSVNGRDPISGRRAFLSQGGWLLKPGQARSFPLNVQVGNSAGRIDVAAFVETPDYPLVQPGLPFAPFGPENFYKGADGVKRWIPPTGFPFRPAQASPNEVLHLVYAVPVSLR